MRSRRLAYPFICFWVHKREFLLKKVRVYMRKLRRGKSTVKSLLVFVPFKKASAFLGACFKLLAAFRGFGFLVWASLQLDLP